MGNVWPRYGFRFPPPVLANAAMAASRLALIAVRWRAIFGGTGGWSPQKDKGAAAPFDCALGDLPRRDPERYRSKLRSVALNDIETVSRRAGLTRGSDRGQPFTTISNPRRDANGSGSNSSARAAAEAIGLRM
jgi:hypothetical protein